MAPTLAQQIREARARYAEALQRLEEATRFYQQFTLEADDFRKLVSDESQRAHIVRRGIESCAHWDAETSAAEIRLARLGRIAIVFHMDDKAVAQYSARA